MKKNGNLFPDLQQWKTVLSLLSSVRSDGSLQVRLCLADESGGQMVKGPGGEREGMRGSDPCRRLNWCRCAGRSRLRCCMRTERQIESWCRTEVPWETVCVWVWFILFEAGLVLSLQTYWSVGGIFFHMQGGTGNYPVFWAAAFVFILILVPLLLCVFLGGFCICLPHIQWPWKRKYSCSIYLQAVNDQWVWSGGTRLPRRPCVHWLPLQRRARLRSLIRLHMKQIGYENIC